jgi:hypothetical protein
MSQNWKEYVEKTKNSKPRPLLVEALMFVLEKNQALDLGAGALNDSSCLLNENFNHVTAVDKEAVAGDIAKSFPSDRFTYSISSFENYNFPFNTYDLINAQFSLPFISPESFGEVWEKIKNSLKKEGVFAGQLFGEHDEWSKNPQMTFQNAEKVDELLKSFEILSLSEVEKDSLTAKGDMKHWHIFHFIVRK